MFQGDYIHNIDAKNRLFIPAKFREELGDSFVVCPSPDGCLFVYTEEHWQQIAAQIAQKSSSRIDRIRQRNALFGVTTVSPDKQGRITLTPRLIEKAHLQKEVMIFGMTNRIEIWDMERWNRMMDELPQSEDGMDSEDLYPEINY